MLRHATLQRRARGAEAILGHRAAHRRESAAPRLSPSAGLAPCLAAPEREPLGLLQLPAVWLPRASALPGGSWPARAPPGQGRACAERRGRNVGAGLRTSRLVARRGEEGKRRRDLRERTLGSRGSAWVHLLGRCKGESGLVEGGSA